MNRRGEKWLARYFLLDESVPLDEVEIYLYGVRLLIKKLCHIIFIILLGFFFGEFFSIAIFLITYAHIREYSGGYHKMLWLYYCGYAVCYRISENFISNFMAMGSI